VWYLLNRTCHDKADPMSFNIEKMHKLSVDVRFLDLNDLWYFPNRWVVRWLYPLPVTASQVTVCSLLMGVAAAGCYLVDSYSSLVWGAAFLYGKIFLDNVDGNLARARGEVSRLGRFLDSLTDFMVSVLVYVAITWRLVSETDDLWFWFLGGTALLACLLHCSYFVFYLVNYSSRAGSYRLNRVDENISKEDRESYERKELSPLVYFLQRCHAWVYGWQDRLIGYIDRVSQRLALGQNPTQVLVDGWYADKMFLTLSSPLCLCTNNMGLVVFSLLDRLDLGLILIVVLGNVYLTGLQVWKVLRDRVKH
jgi:phosphatidylglycerophosphate synthase